jgi:hypothetical protein
VTETQIDKLHGAARRALLVGAIALAVAVLVGLLRPAAFFYGYLCGFVLWSGVPLGAAALLMMHHLVSGRWGWSIRGLLEAAAITLPLLLPLFVPLAVGAPELYGWVHPSVATVEQASPFRHTYLTLPFFLARAAAFLVLWGAGGWLLVRWSRRQPVGARDVTWGLARLSAVGLVVYFLTESFAGVDWIGSLAVNWYSSVLGLYLIVGQALTALATVILLALVLQRRFGVENALAPAMLNDLGNLLLAFVVLHAYLAYAQFFIIWNGNLPRANTWYAPRMGGFWGWASWLLILVHFGLPFFALLFRRVKRDQRTLLALVLVILSARAFEALWLVLPAAPQPQWLGVMLALCAMVGIGGIWLAVFAWRYGSAPARSASAAAPGGS